MMSDNNEDQQPWADYPLRAISPSNALPHLRGTWQDLNSKPLPTDTESQLVTLLNSNSRVSRPAFFQNRRPISSGFSKPSRKRTGIDSNTTRHDISDTEMTDAATISNVDTSTTSEDSHTVHIRKSLNSPAPKRRLIDTSCSNAANNIINTLANSSSIANLTISSPTNVIVNQELPRILTPSNSTHNASISFSEELQQLPLPSPSASPVHSSNVNDTNSNGKDDDNDEEEEDVGDDPPQSQSQSQPKQRQQPPQQQQIEDMMVTPPTPLMNESGVAEIVDPSTEALLQLMLPNRRRSELMYFIEKLLNLLPKGSPETNYLLCSLLQKADRLTLSSLQGLMRNSLRRDVISALPTEVVMKIFGYLDFQSLLVCEEICKSWNNISTQSYSFWKSLLLRDGFMSTDEEFTTEFRWIKRRLPVTTTSAEVAKLMYKRRTIISRRWKDLNFTPRRITLPSQGGSVITCLQFDEDKIVAGSDDNSITIYDTETGDLRSVLMGHNGGVWAMKYYGNTLASGSTDRSVRIWNIKQGRCTHIFRGHMSTVRCLEIIAPQKIGTDDMGNPILFPKKPLLVTGSRDSTLYVWKLPVTGEDEELPNEPMDLDENRNPFLVKVLRGHTESVRAVAGWASVLVSSSYDGTSRVWDLRTCECKWLLSGHTDRIYSCVLDVQRNRCITGSVDNTVKIWDLDTGKTLATLEGHHMLVGLITLSKKALVSAAADSTVRIWDPETGDARFVLRGHTAAITCVEHSDDLVISGSLGMLKLWDTKTGKLVRDLLDDVDGGVWQVKFDYRRCITAVQKHNRTCLEILDFGVPEVTDLLSTPDETE